MTSLAENPTASGAPPQPLPTTSGSQGPERRQRVRVPWRLVATPFYSDIALAVYIKVAALGRRPEGCTASTARLAEYLGMSKASVERGIALLRRPAPDGVVELPQNTRRSLPGGSGTTARRRVRPMTTAERFVWLPVAAAEDLTPRQLRAYAALMYAQAQQMPLTLQELAGMLRHSSGQRAGQMLTAAAAGAVVDGLETAGWLTVQRRAGAQGRHQYIAHSIPPLVAPRSAEPAPGASQEATADAPMAPVVDEGSGPQADEGWLANKEDPRTVRPDDGGALASPAVGEIAVVGAPEPARQTLGASAPAPTAGSLALRAGGYNHSSSPKIHRTLPGGGGAAPSLPYHGPQLTLSAQIYAVLEPVHWLLKDVNSSYVQRQIAREIGRQLREGMDPARLRHRLTTRLAHVSPSQIRDVGRWLLGVALPRWGCGHFDCEAGVMWSTGRRCDACADVTAERSAARRRAQRLEEGRCPDHGCRPDVSGVCMPYRDEQATGGGGGAAQDPVPGMANEPQRGTCADCGARILLVGRATGDGLCKLCREESMDELTAAADGAQEQRDRATCVGCNGVPCGRPALLGRLVCVRHRAVELTMASA